MIIDKDKYIEHIKDKEQHLTMRKILDKIEQVIRNHEIVYTDFLDPYQRKLCYSFLNRFIDVSYYEEGGLENAERKSIIMFPSYLNKLDIENPIKSLIILGGSKFKELNHRDYLGTILGLGIKREKLGDINVHKTFGQVIVHRDLVDFIRYNLKSINTEPVKVNEIALSELIPGKEDYRDIYTTVASLRLDVIISTSCNIPRSKSTSYIEQGKVKVNWQPVISPSYLLDAGDIISLKGYGRIKLLDDLGDSKKGRTKIIVRIFE
ncbi:RNA-binding protein [Brassicibacter mesophilus]|uniref:YlmH family RNA-binding protein n=1 Tax=Brassicibacter mesophilus TaxID=745119 RepID=UPI003D1B7987